MPGVSFSFRWRGYQSLDLFSLCDGLALVVAWSLGRQVKTKTFSWLVGWLALPTILFAQGQAVPPIVAIDFAGLEGDPGYELAQRYANGKPSGILSFGIKGGAAAGGRFIDALNLVTRLVNIVFIPIQMMVVHYISMDNK